MALTVLRDRNTRILVAGHSTMLIVLAIWMIDLTHCNAAAGLAACTCR
jgi:hypothetical protein